VLATPPFGASSNKALLRANVKPPVELVVADYPWKKRMSFGKFLVCKKTWIVESE